MPSAHRASPDIAHLARLDEVVERLHGLLGGSIRVEAVNLVEVDVRGVEALERTFHSVEDCGAREAHPVGVLPALAQGLILGWREDVVVVVLRGEEKAFGQDDDFVAGDLILFGILAIFWAGRGVKEKCTFSMNLATMRSESPFE